MEQDAFRSCNTCKREIPFAARYYVCSVSTCQRRATDFAFCSVECWEAHVPLFRHRDSGAVDRVAPTRSAWQAERRRAEEEEVQRAARASERTQPTPIVPSGVVRRDVLVVVSKLKDYVRARSGMNTSDGVVEVLSDRLRDLCDRAIERASRDGRKTVLDRDF
jgi:hypothetical protein